MLGGDEVPGSPWAIKDDRLLFGELWQENQKSYPWHRGFHVPCVVEGWLDFHRMARVGRTLCAPSAPSTA